MVVIFRLRRSPSTIAHRQPRGAHGGGIVAERPIRYCDPRPLEDLAPEGLRGLRRPQAVAGHLFYRDARLVGRRTVSASGSPATAVPSARAISTQRANRGRRHERPSRIVDRDHVGVVRRRERRPARLRSRFAAGRRRSRSARVTGRSPRSVRVAPSGRTTTTIRRKAPDAIADASDHASTG